MGHSAPPRRYLANSQPLLSRRMGVTAYHQAGGTYLLSPLSLPSLSIFARTALDTEVLERISANHSPHPSLLCGKAAVSSTSPPSSAKTCVLPFYSHFALSVWNSVSGVASCTSPPSSSRPRFRSNNTQPLGSSRWPLSAMRLDLTGPAILCDLAFVAA